jgi:hypothetical protein
MFKRILVGIMALGVPGLGLTLAGAEVDVGGDIRLREEYVDQEGRDERNRLRFRSRVNITAKESDQVKAGLRLSSGGDSPIGRNQSLDDSFSLKHINLDRAFVDWHLDDAPLRVTGGKMANPMVLARDLVWDGDVTPEGINLNLGGGEAWPLDINTGFYVVEERRDDDETTLWGSTATADIVGLHIGVGYFMYDEVKGRGPVFRDNAFGNTTTRIGEGDDAVEVLANDYGLFEFAASCGADLGGLPGTIYLDYVVNHEATSAGDTGYQVGIGIGKVGEPGTWSLDLNYRDLEADAVFATFADSSFIGGGTNGEGWKFSGKVQLSRNLQAAFACFINRIDPGGEAMDYHRLHVDLSAKF